MYVCVYIYFFVNSFYYFVMSKVQNQASGHTLVRIGTKQKEGKKTEQIT